MFSQNNKKPNSFPPSLNQQTGQWHFYDDEGKPIDLLKKSQADEVDDRELSGCCSMRRR